MAEKSLDHRFGRISLHVVGFCRKNTNAIPAASLPRTRESGFLHEIPGFRVMTAKQTADMPGMTALSSVEVADMLSCATEVAPTTLAETMIKAQKNFRNKVSPLTLCSRQNLPQVSGVRVRRTQFPCFLFHPSGIYAMLRQVSPLKTGSSTNFQLCIPTQSVGTRGTFGFCGRLLSESL
jgi:hypothetical protein